MHTQTGTRLQINRRRYRTVRNVVVVWLTGVVIAAFLLPLPKIHILEQTARNLIFHVPMWFTMMAAFLVAAYHAVGVLRTGDPVRDVRTREAARVGVLFGILGLLTGMMWSRFTWYVSADIWWNFDPKQTMVAVQLLIFGAYFVLRSSIDNPEKRARAGAVYLLFAVATAPFLLYVIPRQLPSLHPGAEGNPAFSDITHPNIRYVFYPAIIGFIGLFWVLYTQRVRVAFLKLSGEETAP